MNQRSGAHRARFYCRKHLAIFQSVIRQGDACLSQRDKFGVGRRIPIADITIPSAAHNPALINHNRPHGHFTHLKSSLCRPQGLFHPKLVRVSRAGFVRHRDLEKRHFNAHECAPASKSRARQLSLAHSRARARHFSARNVILACMGIPNLLRKILMVDLLKGLRVTFRYQDPKEIYTEQYPLERPQVAERYRGAPRLNVNPETNETLCIACDLCALACPEHLIVVSSERNEKTRRKELTTFTYDLSRCMFCGLCEDACPTDCLELTQDFELANYTREGAIWDRQTLERGPQPTRYER